MGSATFKLLAFVFICFLSVEARPKLIVGETKLQEGQSQLLLCKAFKEAEISWLKDDEEVDLDRHEVKKDESTSTLTLNKVQFSDSGTYTCVCDSDGDETRESIDIFVYEEPKFGSTKTYHEFLVNETANIPCTVSGKPSVEVMWYWKGFPLTNNGLTNMKTQQDGSLQITNIQRENQGAYTCEGIIKGHNDLKRQLHISVVVNSPPTVRISQERAHVVSGPNTDVTINCLVTGAPHPNITWTTPPASDSSRYIYNSDKSTLLIPAVVREDFGEYVCTGANKIGESNASFTLDVSERPSVILSQSELAVRPGESASMFCSATGHPAPTLQWRRKEDNKVVSPTGRLRVEGSKLIIENTETSDGGVYSCSATNSAGSSTKDFSLITSPAVPVNFEILPGPSSAHITLRAPVPDGGSSIVQYVVQFKKRKEDNWSKRDVLSSGPLVLKSLDAYTEYIVKFAAKNKHFLGGFSAEKRIWTLAKGEPDVPVLAEGKIEQNSYSFPIEQMNNGGSALTHYVVRYRVNNENETWTEEHQDANSQIIQLNDLKYDSEYQVEVFAVNKNGSSNPASLTFSVPEAQKLLGRGGIVGIIMTVFLLILVAVDALCCYTNHCGLLNFINRKLFGHKMSKSASVEDGVINNAAVDLNGLDKPRGSIPKLQSQHAMNNRVQSAVTSDKAPLTKFEKAPAKTIQVNEA